MTRLSVTVVCLAAGLLAGCGGDRPTVPDAPSPAPGRPPATTAAEQPSDPVTAHLDGIAQQGAVLGNPDAPVTVVEYIDLYCPVCARYTKSTGRELIAGPVKDGQVKLELRHYPILGDASQEAAVWQLAAARQDLGWQFAEAFYARQPEAGSDFDSSFALEIANQVGLDPAQLLRDIEDPQLRKTVEQHAAEADKLGLPGTPGLVVHGPGGRQLMAGLVSFDQVTGAVRAVHDK